MKELHLPAEDQLTCYPTPNLSLRYISVKAGTVLLKAEKQFKSRKVEEI